MQEYVIIVAGGSGSRMQSEIPKQFLKISGKEIILHTIDRFIERNSDTKIIISCHPDYISYTKNILSENNYSPDIQIVPGGETRFHSVKNGLNAISDTNSLVAIHDAARPLVSTATINRCYEIAFKQGNAIPVIPVHESLRKTENNSNAAVNRTDYKIVQTPQCFAGSLIKQAFEQPYDSSFTDDASVIEKAGHAVILTEGNSENIKITLPSDLLIAETLIHLVK